MFATSSQAAFARSIPPSLVLISVVLSGALWARPGAAAPPVPLASHRATYDLSLAEGSAGVDAARGRIVYEFGGNACEGYSTSFRQVIELARQGGGIVLDSRNANFEAGDGSTLRFKTESRTPEADEATDGSATQTDQGVAVELTRPERAAFELPQAVFPTTHTKLMLEAARSGRSTFEATIFDGSEKGRKVSDSFTVIGKPVSRAAGAVEDAVKAAGWDGMTRWPVTVSYFETGAASQQPSYTMSFELFENGVARNLTLDFNGFVLRGALRQLEALTTSPCDK